MLWRWTERVARYLTYAGAGLILLMMLVVVVDVFGTYFFHWPLPGGYEIVSLLVPVSAFLCLTSTEVGKNKMNIRMEILADRVPGRGKHILLFVSYLIGAIVLGVYTWQTGIDMVTAIRIKAMAMGEAISLPVYPFKPFVTLGFGLTSLVFLLCAVDQLRVARTGPNGATETRQ